MVEDVNFFRTRSEATATRLQDAAHTGRPLMISGGFRVRAGVPLEGALPRAESERIGARAIDAISEGGGALTERQHPTEAEEPRGSYRTGDRMQAWGTIGVVWGALWGALFGSEFFVVPGLQTVFGIPVTSWIIGALEGGLVLGIFTAVVAGLLSLGTFNKSAVE